MPTPLRVSVLVAAVIAGQLATAAPVRPQAEAPDLGLFLAEIQLALEAGTAEAYQALLAQPVDDLVAREAAAEMYLPGATRVTVRERDRSALSGALPGEGFRLMVEMLSERGRQARIGTWRLDVRIARRGDERVWRIVGQERLSSLDGLHQLALDTTTQYAVEDLVIEATDLRLSMSSGHAFVGETAQGVTALVLRGRGEMRFTPQPAAERTQLRIFAGSDSLITPFDQAFIRINPDTFDSRVAAGALTPRAVNDRDLRRAQGFFQDNVSKTYTLDLRDLDRERWSLLPAGDDMVAEVHTRRFDMLTYAKSANEPEDISLFDRTKRRNISTYASPVKLLQRGRFYNEDDLVDFDVLDYKINAVFDPQREWIDGLATLSVRAKASVISSLTLRLDEALVVRSVSSPPFGRLMHLRVVGQNNLIVNLPAAVPRDTELELTVVYGGRLPAQSLDREAIFVEQDQLAQFDIAIQPEPHWVYSNRVHWYPRSPVNDYATATLRITVPDDYTCIASGVQAVGSPIRLGQTADRKASKIFVFIAGQPVRYLSCVISQFVAVSLPDDPDAEADRGGAILAVWANPRQQGRGRSLSGDARAILDFFTEVIGETPYPQFTLALTESQLPGGHSPAYFAVLNQPLPTSTLRWRNDPVSFESFPSFFLAHEIAHQWWGQGVGWANYHEQWLSEGLAQYFAALYAARERGGVVFGNLMRQMRNWSLRYSDQGPIYLGYRLGHVKGESRIFRALVYNKAAVVLHMLRRLLGDDAFFDGLRRFYTEYKYRKAGSDDLRRTMEAASGTSLERFFEQWIYGSAIPRLRFSAESRGRDDENGAFVRVRFEQVGNPVDLPVTVTLVFESGDRRDVIVKVVDPVTEATIPFEGRLREILVNDDNAALAEIDR